MRRLLPLLLLLCMLPAAAGLFDSRAGGGLFGGAGKTAFLPVEEAFKPSVLRSDAQSIQLHFENAEGYYLYRHRISVRSEPTDGIGSPELPAGKPKQDEYFGAVEVYYGALDIRIPRLNTDALRLTVSYQGCADKGLCYPPQTLTLAVDAATRTENNAPPIAAPNSALNPVSPGLAAVQWKEVLLFFLAGLGLTFTPCVLPMLPILSGVVLRGQAGGWRGVSLSLAYVLPMAASFALLGALMGLFGAEFNLQARLQSAWVLVPFALFFTAFALAMFGVYELQLPTFLRERLDTLAGRTQGGSLLGAAVLGVLSSLLVSPCVSAPLAGALLYISTSGDALGGALRLFMLGLGMGLPMLVLASGGNALLPKAGPWMVSVRNAFGVLLLGVVVWLLDRLLPAALTLALWGTLAGGVALALGALEFTPKTARQRLVQLAGLLLLTYAVAAWWGALKGAHDPLRPLAINTTTLSEKTSVSAWKTLTSSEELARALQTAQAAHQPVLLDWYADWCISCKVLEREVLVAPSVLAQLNGWQLIRFDMTASNPDQRALLDRYQLFGPPVLQIFAPNGQERLEVRTVGETDAASFSARLVQANRAFTVKN